MKSSKSTNSITQVVILDEKAEVPTKAHEDDSGFDLKFIDVHKIVGDVIFFRTGISISPPDGFYYDIVPRSSISNFPLMLANSVAVIDSMYTGEILVPIRVLHQEQGQDKTHNSFPSGIVKIFGLSPNTMVAVAQQILSKKPKLCQLILRKREDTEFVVVDRLQPTERGAGGFGSTDSKQKVNMISDEVIESQIRASTELQALQEVIKRDEEIFKKLKDMSDEYNKLKHIDKIEKIRDVIMHKPNAEQISNESLELAVEDNLNQRVGEMLRSAVEAPGALEESAIKQMEELLENIKSAPKAKMQDAIVSKVLAEENLDVNAMNHRIHEMIMAAANNTEELSDDAKEQLSELDSEDLTSPPGEPIYVKAYIQATESFTHTADGATKVDEDSNLIMEEAIKVYSAPKKNVRIKRVSDSESDDIIQMNPINLNNTEQIKPMQQAKITRIIAPKKLQTDKEKSVGITVTIPGKKPTLVQSE